MANKIKYLHLKYIPTGNVFKLPEKEAKEILRSDRGNYKITDAKFVDDTTAKAETTVSQQVVDDTTEKAENP